MIIEDWIRLNKCWTALSYAGEICGQIGGYACAKVASSKSGEVGMVTTPIMDQRHTRGVSSLRVLENKQSRWIR